MCRDILFFCGLLLVAIRVCHAELFTASVHLESLLTVEKAATDKIDTYIALEQRRLNQLKEIAKSFKNSHEELMKIGAKKLAENPLNKFRRLKRLTSDFSFAEDLMRSTQSQTEYFGNVTGFPSREDLRGASVAIFRLQDVYRLTPRDMANGKIQGTTIKDKMSAHDCFELGRQAYWEKDYYHCILWLEETESRLRREKDTPSVEETELLDFMAFALFHQGNLQRAWQMAKRILHMKPGDERAKDNVKYFQEEMEKEGIKTSGKAPSILNARPGNYDNEERELFESLCRGNTELSVEKKSKLYCYYKRDRPYLRLAGLKVEIIHHEPMAAIFREVLSEYEVGVIKMLATPKLNRATIFNRVTGNLEHAEYRITKSAWLKSHHHPVIAQINRRLDVMTNLDQNAAEDFQVANYGLGGHYSPHFDHSTKGEDDPYEDGQGNRIATVLFYLNKPIAGGATVFLPVKQAVFPSARDALFWYNLRLSGEPDDRTRHAACPVLAGQKWVSNKWIHERKQEFRRPCGLNPDSEDERIAEFL